MKKKDTKQMGFDFGAAAEAPVEPHSAAESLTRGEFEKCTGHRETLFDDLEAPPIEALTRADVEKRALARDAATVPNEAGARRGVRLENERGAKALGATLDTAADVNAIETNELGTEHRGTAAGANAFETNDLGTTPRGPAAGANAIETNEPGTTPRGPAAGADSFGANELGTTPRGTAAGANSIGSNELSAKHRGTAIETNELGTTPRGPAAGADSFGANELGTTPRGPAAGADSFGANELGTTPRGPAAGADSDSSGANELGRTPRGPAAGVDSDSIGSNELGATPRGTAAGANAFGANELGTTPRGTAAGANAIGASDLETNPGANAGEEAAAPGENVAAPRVLRSVPTSPPTVPQYPITDRPPATAPKKVRRLRLVGDTDEEPVDDTPPATIALPAALRLERNLALLAGAGTGKTYSLVTMCLHLLGGARADAEPVAPDQLGLLTFTDKAAAEMRERLRRRLDALADGEAAEPELEASFEAQGKPMPPARFWRRVRDDLGAATIGTFHSLCTQLLRRAPAGSGVNPGFALLDERDARDLLRNVIEREVLRRLEANDALIIDLVRELTFGGATEAGLVDGLMQVFVRLREEGSQPQFLRITDPIQARREFDRALAEAQRLTRDGLQRAWARKPKENEKANAFAAMLYSTSFEQYPVDAIALQKLSGALGHVTELKEARSYVSLVTGIENPNRLDWLHAAVGLAPYESTIRDLLADVMRLHEQALHTRGVLDFTGLLLQSRNLLRDVPTARLEAQARFGALLVDEFQDTNRVQLELVMLLAEQRQGAPRPISQSLESASQEVIELPLARAFLAVVGDRKQGIYEFRGADVTVFEEMARRIENSGGGRAWLQTSWRSSPELVTSLNALMLRVLAKEKFDGAPRAFEVVYTEQDHLKAQRGPVGLPPIVQLVADLPDKPDPDELRAQDADAVARYVRQRLGEGDVRGGQVAMLFQRLTQLETYRQALVRNGVRHRVVRGRGFFGAQEVVDVASWLKLLATPGDSIALAAVLRSPLVCLTDASLVRLALPTQGLDSHRVLFEPSLSLEGFSSDERARFERFRSLFAALSTERDRLGLRALVRVTLETFEVREALAAGPFGEQALANVDKLLELATTRQTAGMGIGEFAGELLQLAQREPREAQGDVLDAYDLDAVTLCTVHQAKGLEWPIVVLPELFAARRSERELIWFDRNEGLALKPFGMSENISNAARERAISGIRNRRAFAENLRLLYVAMTRARDQVVLGLMPKKVGEKFNRWSDVLQNDSWNAVHPIDVATLPAGAPPVDPVSEVAEAASAVRAVLERVRHAPEARPLEAVLPVTQLQDFVSCPRRFHFAHQVGLAERPRSFVVDDVPAPTEVLDVRARGTAAHRLLELTPLEVVGTPELMEVLRALRRSEDLPDDGEDSVLTWVHAFWSSPEGLRIAGLGERRVHRELPFVLPLRDGEFTLHLRGQIDLVVDGPEGLEVLDYKTSRAPPKGLGAYAFQLGCYSVAAAALLGSQRPVRAGIVFLREEDRSARFLPFEDSASLGAQLVEQARALTRSQVTQVFEGRPIETCRALGCGYVYRCH